MQAQFPAEIAKSIDLNILGRVSSGKSKLLQLLWLRRTIQGIVASVPESTNAPVPQERVAH